MFSFIISRSINWSLNWYLIPFFPIELDAKRRRRRRKKSLLPFRCNGRQLFYHPWSLHLHLNELDFGWRERNRGFFFFFGTATAEGIIWNSPWLRPRWKHGIFISIPFFRLTLAGLLALQTQLRYPLFQNNRLIRTRCVWVRGSIYACWDKKWTRQREIFSDCLRLTGI